MVREKTTTTRREVVQHHLDIEGIGYAEFAKQCGITRSILYKFLNEEKDIRLSTWEKIERCILRSGSV